MPKTKSNSTSKTKYSNTLNTAVLFSGGKDSGMALFHALKHTNVKCLIIMQSKNTESYMFHTPNIKFAQIQAQATGIPFIVQETNGEKEEELLDLKHAITRAIQKYKINAVVTGAIESVYQASRIQKITNDLGIECFNPLWQKDQIEHLHDLIKNKFEIIIVGVFGYGLEDMIGKTIDKSVIEKLSALKKQYQINPAGEGGEYESFILNAPFYKKRLTIKKSKIIKDKEGGIVLVIEELS